MVFIRPFMGDDMKNKGFTLAELLGVIVIISLLLILIVPTIINNIAKTKAPSKIASDSVIGTATQQYIDENSNLYPKGKSGKYCIPIQILVDNGYLVSPVKDVETNKDITDKTVLVTIYSQGTSEYEIKDTTSCKEEAAMPTIDFIVNPYGNSWVKSRTVTILYPEVEGDYKSKYKIDEGNWIIDGANSGGKTKLTFTKISTITAQLKGNNTITNKYKVINVDSVNPLITNIKLDSWSNEKQKVNITVKDTISGINGIYISTSSTKPSETSNSWTSFTSKANEEKVYTNSYSLGTYYVWTKDKAGNISDGKTFKITDTVKPTCKITSSGTLGNNNWYTSDVKITLTATDKESGVASKGLTETNNVEYNNVTEKTLNQDVSSKTYYGFVKDKAGNTGTCNLTVKRDATAPTLSISTTSTSKSITVVANAYALSGISKYEYSKDGGSTWVTGTGNTYTFDKLTHGTNYNIKVRVTSTASKQNTASKTVSTVTINKPTFSEETEIGKSKVTVTYPSGCSNGLTCSYSKDGGTNWVTVTSNPTIEFTSNTTLIAKVTDGTNTISTSYNIAIRRTVTYNYKTNGGTSSTKTSAIVNESSAIDLTPTATKSGYTFVGWNTNKDATSKLSSLTMGTSNVTLYAIYRKEAKTITVTFNKNNASTQTNSSGTAVSDTTVTRSCTIAAVYNNASQATTCSVTSPTIVGSSNTPTVVGYNTSSSATTSGWNQNTAKAVSSNATYYAITKANAKTHTITYSKGANVSAIGATTGSCTRAATYNGTAQATSCTVTLPSITAKTGYTSVGWNTTSGATSGTSAGSKYTLTGNKTLYANALDKTAPTTPTISTIYNIWGTKTKSLNGYKSDAGTTGTWETSTNDPIIDIEVGNWIKNIDGAYIELASALTKDINIQIFYATSGNGHSEANSKKATLKAGQTKITITIPNGTYNNVRFDIGNVSGLKYKINKLGVRASNSQWNNSSIITTVSSKDEGSGISKYQYRLGNNGTWTDTGATNNWSPEKNQTIYYRAVDKAGNVSNSSSAKLMMDVTSPTLYFYNVVGGSKLTITYSNCDGRQSCYANATFNGWIAYDASVYKADSLSGVKAGSDLIYWKPTNGSFSNCIWTTTCAYHIESDFYRPIDFDEQRKIWDNAGNEAWAQFVLRVS